MAGSYRHLLPEGDDYDGGWSMIENMGDAYECVQELFWLVEKYIGQSQAKKALDNVFYPMKRGEFPPDGVMQFVERQMEQ